METYVMQLIAGVFTAYLIVKMVHMAKRNTRNKRMLAVLDKFHDEQAFYQAADAFLNSEKDNEYSSKTRILRLWADIRYEHDEEFFKDLEALDLTPIVNEKTIQLNEDSLFYMFLAIPNRLYYRKRMDLLEPLDDKLKEIDEKTASLLVRKISEENRKYYNHIGDLGKEFYTKVLIGDYGQYFYSKHLIAMYKRIVATMLARIALDEGNQEEFNAQLSFLEVFETSPLGERWLMELGIELPHAKEVEEEAE